MARQLAAGRAVAGVAMLAAPVLSARLLGADTATARRVVWLTRMMAVRDGALGAGGLAAMGGKGAGGSAAPWLIGGAVSDAVDAMVLAQAVRGGRANGIGARLLVPLAAGAAALGAVTALRLSRR